MLMIYRMAHWLWLHKVPMLPRALYIFNRLVFGIVLPPSAQVGRSVIFGYSGLAIVVHKRAVIEDDVNIGPGCVIGGRSGYLQVPIIRQGALIGAGAKVIGPVVVGRFARVGANAVVLEDVPDGGVVVGIPARMIRINPIPDSNHTEKAA